MARERIRTLAILRVAAAAAIASFALASAAAQTRAFGELYPGMDQAALEAAAGAGGLSASCTRSEELKLLPAGEAGEALRAALAGRDYGFLSETLSLVKEGGRPFPGKLALYNAVSQVRSLSGITYRSSSRKAETVLFDQVTRVSGPGGDSVLPDTAEAALAPRSGFFVRLRDANFGISYYRMDFDSRTPGILLSLTNVRALSVFLIPVLPEGGMFCLFYLEPTDRGLAIYTLSGARLGGFASGQVDIPSAVRKRVGALRSWLIGRLAG